MFKDGQRPSAEQMREMGADIHTKLGKLLAKYDLTVEEYRKRSPEVFADEAAVKGYLNEHPDMKARYEALPLDRMGQSQPHCLQLHIQYLLQLQHQRRLEVTTDNVAQTLARILEHESRYKPDGLKALGIIILCFGRTYEYRRANGQVKMDNPLNLKGLENDNEVLTFAELLTGLQHYRNPYIHPEISDMQKISKIRETTLRCMVYISRLV